MKLSANFYATLLTVCTDQGEPVVAWLRTFEQPHSVVFLARLKTKWAEHRPKPRAQLHD